jgi:NADPH-dependent 2,4-dienoyl-CoA reductase/sulfur reductase-like enzyme
LSESCDIAVIGAGPAGLAAASLAASRGARTVLLDEQPQPGGQIYRGIEAIARDDPALFRLLGPDYGRGLDLIRNLRASAADYRPESAVWQITPEKEIWYSRGGTSLALTARAIVLATGAIERPVPLPGWTLPGVMSAGALQILLKTSGAMPTKPLVLVGAGPLLLLLAKQYLDAGVRPAAVLDTAKGGRRWTALRHLPAALGGAGRTYLAKGMALMSALRRSGVPVFRNIDNVAVEGTTQAEAVTFTSAGQRQRVPASLIGLHEGVLPSQQVARSLSCDFEWSDAQRSFRPVTDEWGRSSVAGVLIAGDGAGIGGAIAAEHGSRIAALEALHQVGRLDESQRNAAALPERRAQRDHLAIRPFIDALYPPAQQILTPADDVVICRCEEVQAKALREVIALGCQGPNQAKSFLRCGMGPCQGRLCGPTVSEIFAQMQSRTPGEVGYYRIRPPLKPLTVREFAEIDPGT